MTLITSDLSVTDCFLKTVIIIVIIIGQTEKQNKKKKWTKALKR